MVGKIKHLFDIRKQNKQKLFIILVFFLLSFSIARLGSIFVGKSLFIEGYHIHHFYWGTLILAFGGLLGVLNNDARRLKIASALIGIGMGLFADEIGLLLNCTTNNRYCTYFFPKSSDIIIAIAVIITFFIAIADTDFYLIIKRHLKTQLEKIF